MKKICCLMALCLLLAGCGKKEETLPPAQSGAAVSAPAVSAPEKPKTEELELLTAEFQREGADGQVLMKAVKQLPAQLLEAFAAEGVQAEEAKVTMSGSAAATAQAVAEGGVSFALLSAKEAADTSLTVAALAGQTRTHILAAPTAYGGNLASRADPTWTELDHARWGILAESLWGEEGVKLYLADHYEGNGVEDLSDVTVYDSEEALFAAAAAGEIDVFPAPAPMEDMALLGTGDALYTVAAVVSDEALSAAVPGALSRLQQGEFAALFGAEPFAAAEEGALDAHKRLNTLAE